MRPIANVTLHAALATALIAFAATSAAAQGDVRTYTGGRFYLDIGGEPGVIGRAPGGDGHPQRIEILSYNFGDNSAVELEPAFIKSWSTSGDAGATPPRGGNVNAMSMDDTAGKEKKATPTAISHDLRTNVIARTAPPPGSGGGAARANDRLRNAGPKDGSASSGGDPDRPIVAGNVPNASAASVGAAQSLTVGGARTETASGQATGKRQHLPIRTRTYYDQPLEKGSVWVRVSSPWAACRVGARYPSLELGGGAKRYVLQDVTVASCGGSGDADDRPTEEVAFYYNKVTVRGWDPKKKEE